FPRGVFPFSRPSNPPFLQAEFQPASFPCFPSLNTRARPLPHRAALSRPDGIVPPSGSLF
ncbi:hypothetical protein, partial [Neisseria gonorrhoeae]|uniref:hypothetical protein n=1 Tax=Neisseria gonorrhoeae TaxID=485 RepID=UPI00352FE6E8